MDLVLGLRKRVSMAVIATRNQQGKFASDKEPLTAKLSLRIEASVLKRIQCVPNWQEKIRELIYLWVEED